MSDEPEPTKPFSFLLTAEERSLLNRAADAAGRVPVGIWIRTVVLEKAREVLAERAKKTADITQGAD